MKPKHFKFLTNVELSPVNAKIGDPVTVVEDGRNSTLNAAPTKALLKAFRGITLNDR